MGQMSMSDWREMLEHVRHPQGEVRIAVVGKYIKLQDAYKSIYEALDHAGAARAVRVVVDRVEAEELEAKGPERLAGAGGILVPGGFGTRGIEGKLVAVRFARENGVPFLGICLGMQCAVIEFARNVLGLERANSAEFDPETPDPVIALLDEQKKVTKMGGTMRLGAFPCRLETGSLAHAAYGQDDVSERHRHRYEFNNEYRDSFGKAGVRFSGLSPDGALVEMIELAREAGHPWFVATQAHPEFKSRPVAPHPLFRAFVEAAAIRKGSPHESSAASGPLSG